MIFVPTWEIFHPVLKAHKDKQKVYLSCKYRHAAVHKENNGDSDSIGPGTQELI